MSAKEDKSKDKELDDLLDSALEDFDKTDEVAKGESTEKSALPVPEGAPENPWDEEFIKSQVKMFEDRMSKMFEGGPEDGFHKMAEAAALALNPDTENVSDPQFTQTLTDALRGLSEGAESLQSPFSPDDIAEMFGNVDLAGASSGENNAFLPFMQSMMQSLLSAEVLLPSLQDLVSKYPKWLEENGSKVPAADKERYEKQHELLKTVCGELEKESPNDTPEVKRQQFQKVFESMQKMQELGQPPAELMDVSVDPTQLGNPNQCPMM